MSRNAIVEQDLQYQGSSPAAAIKDPAARASGDDAAGDAASQAKGDGWRTRHAINVRLSIPLLFVHCYLTIVGGKERRDSKRRIAERRKNPLATPWNIAFLAVLGLITGLALFTVIQFAARLVLERAGVV